MKRVSRNDVVAGMVTAERITDVKHNILLEANTVISENNAAVLKTWNIGFIRIREDNDTDRSLKEQLQLDRQAEAEEKREENRAQKAAMKASLGITPDNVASIISGGGDRYLYSDGREIGLGGSSVKISSILSPESLGVYVEILKEVGKLFAGDARERELFVRDSNKMALRLSRYIVSTPAAIGYALYPHKTDVLPLAGHTMRVAVLAGKLAQLLGYDAKGIMLAVHSALLHDIGCLLLPDTIKNCDRVFTPAEEKLFESHVLSGVNMVKGRHYFPKELLLAVGGHHERMDGSGYPLHLKMEKIHHYARILALANEADMAMYPLARGGEGLNLQELIDELPLWATAFDADMCMLLQSYLRDFMLSNRVTLEDGRRAEIIWSHRAYKEPVIRTNDGEIIDLNKALDLNINTYSI